MLRAALATAPARRFFAAHAQSCLGTGVAYVALPLLAYDRFGSAWAVAAVLLPELLPAILLGPVLGALVDRWGWRACATLAHVLLCLGFLALLGNRCLPAMIAGASLAGLGTALFTPAALTGLPRLAPGERRPAAMGLYGALDDIGLTAGPALAGVLLAVTGPSTLLALNAITYAVSVVLIGTLKTNGAPEARQAPRSLLADARDGIREVVRRPEVRTLLSCSTAVVLCIGVTAVGEVVLARHVLGVSGSGLAAMITVAGIGTMVGSLAARFRTACHWRRAYLIGLVAMATELLGCAILPSFWLIVPILALGGFGNGLALVHDRLLLSHALPESLHGRLFALQKMLVSLAFALSFVSAGALIALGGARLAFLCSGVALVAVTGAALPRLRAAWPAPAPSATPVAAAGDALA